MGKFLVLINQSFCGCLIDAKQIPNTLFINFSTELKKQKVNVFSLDQQPVIRISKIFIPCCLALLIEAALQL